MKPSYLSGYLRPTKQAMIDAKLGKNGVDSKSGLSGQ